MSEPTPGPVRPICMKLVVAALALVVLAGCGSAEQGSGGAAKSKPSPSSTVVTCIYNTGRLLTRADVDGDGTDDEIRLSPRSAESCPADLAAVTRRGASQIGVSLSDDEPPVSGAFAIAPPGQKAQLLVTKADHPRGGYQLRIYAAGSDELVELKADDQSLLPFVATDVQEHPWSIDCSDDGLVFTEAVAHEPVGVAAAWDIQQTTYTLDGASITKGPTKEIEDNVLPQDLKAKYPDLVEHAAFESCRA